MSTSVVAGDPAVLAPPAPPTPSAPSGAEATAKPNRVGPLDGLRGIAVLAVLAYHFFPRTLPAGFLGVDVFMVLSGYLITGLLIAGRAEHGRVALGRFWSRRLRRLAPAMLFLVAAVTAWAHLDAARALQPTMRSQGLAALAYLSNWRLIADAVSYGGAIAAESPFLHLWSLAVEAQFYVVWAVVVAAVLAITRGRRAAVAVVAAAAAVASAAWMALLFEPAADPLRIYYGTDTRAQAFLLGAFVAAVPVGRLARGRLAPIAATVALAGISGAFLFDVAGFLYRGGFFTVAASTGVVIATANTGGPAGWLLDRAWLRLVGRVSYGIYLWHWPAVVLLTPARTGWDGVALLAARLAFTTAGTALSWWLVERPATGLRSRAFAIAIGAGLTVVVAALLALPATSVTPYADVDVTDIPRPAVVTAPASTAAPGTVEPGSVEPGTVVIIGDSGMFDESPALTAAFQAGGWTVVDASFPGVGVTKPGSSLREVWAETVVQHSADLVVVMLGNWDIEFVRTEGDDAYRRELDDAVRSIQAGGADVLWLSMLPGGRTPDRPVDRFFAELPGRHDGVTYLDIESALRAPDGSWPIRDGDRLLRKPDEWHLCPDGAAAVAAAVVAAAGVDAGSAWPSAEWRNDVRYNDPPGGCAG